jgi:hypothetical protein
MVETRGIILCLGLANMVSFCATESTEIAINSVDKQNKKTKRITK